MALLQSVLGRLAGWLTFVASLLVPGVVAAVLWTPFLIAKRVRSLFEALPPRESLVPSYVVACVGASLPFVVGALIALVTSDVAAADGGIQLSNRLFTLSLALSVAYTAGLPLVGVIGLPRAGVDWDPTGYGASTWLILAAGGAWYAFVFALPLVAFALVLGLPGGY